LSISPHSRGAHGDRACLIARDHGIGDNKGAVVRSRQSTALRRSSSGMRRMRSA
jgi:hypothetical protein